MSALENTFTGLLLAVCLLVSIGCFIAAGAENDGSYAVAGANMAFAFLYCHINMDKKQ